MAEKPRHLMYVQNLEYLKIDGIPSDRLPTTEEVYEFLSARLAIRSKSCDKWAFIIHDKDTYTKDDIKKIQKIDPNRIIEEGAPKAPHVHLYAHFSNGGFTREQFSKWFDDIPETTRLVQRGSSCLEYLCHFNHPDKYPYPVDELFSNFDLEKEIARFKQEEEDSKKFTKLVKDYDCGKIKMCEAIRFLDENMDHSSEWTKAKKDLRERFEIRTQSLASQLTQPREVILVYGESGVGKTKFAELLADALVKSEGLQGVCMSSNINDPLQNYLDEDIFIFDEFRTDDGDNRKKLFVSLLRLFDNHTPGSFASRFKNKVFTGRYIILTTSEPISTFFEGITEDRWQFYRRISQLVVVTKDEVQYRYSEMPTGEFCGFCKDTSAYKEFYFPAPVVKTAKNPLMDYIKAHPEQTKKPADLASVMSIY